MIDKVIMFAIIIAVSFTATKLGWLDDKVRDGLSRFIIKVTAPLMIFTSIASLEYEKTLVKEAVAIVLIALAVILFLVAIAKTYVRVAQLDEKTKGVQVAIMSFGNVAFLAYPLFKAVFGAIGIFYGAFYHVVNDITFWTIGFASIDYKSSLSKKERYRNIINQNSIAIVLGVVAFFTRFYISPVIFEPLEELGKTTVYLSLAFIGTTMASVDISKTYKKLSIYVAIIIKMLIVPIVVAFVLTNIYSFGLSTIAISVVVLQISMPVMTIVAISANEVGGNYKYASEAVFVTTVASLVTMPIILRIVHYFLP
ncbi:MAG: AEC family transporter [Firmicutes bacterium]|nr:AEC family transporter [Bacillota bacterium]